MEKESANGHCNIKVPGTIASHRIIALPHPHGLAVSIRKLEEKTRRAEVVIIAFSLAHRNGARSNPSGRKLQECRTERERPSPIVNWSGRGRIWGQPPARPSKTSRRGRPRGARHLDLLQLQQRDAGSCWSYCNAVLSLSSTSGHLPRSSAAKTLLCMRD